MKCALGEPRKGQHESDESMFEGLIEVVKDLYLKTLSEFKNSQLYCRDTSLELRPDFKVEEANVKLVEIIPTVMNTR
jgi:hypothetical protein